MNSGRTCDEACAKHQRLIAQAMKAIHEAAGSAAADPHRLHIHFMAPSAWINDPNGLIFFNGEYHMFYQIHPYSAENGPKHWGHAKSKDLVHWEHLPVALAPGEDYDRNGCFSGTAVETDGRMMLIYTGNVVSGGRKIQVQCLASSDDGVHFHKYGANPVIREFPADGSMDFRDPKVWRHQDAWYMAVGSGKDGRGNALLYRSRDLYDWRYVGKMAESRSEEEGIVWNCPDFFRVGDKDVLMVSPAVWKGNRHQVRKVLYYIGRMDYEQGRFLIESAGDVDYGWDFYAPQTLVDDQGRVILIAWMDMWFNDMPTKARGWAGAMTLPREVYLTGGGKLGFRPARELSRLREVEHAADAFRLDGGDEAALPFAGAVFEMELVCAAETNADLSLHVILQGDRDERPLGVVAYDGGKRELSVTLPGTEDGTEDGAEGSSPGSVPNRCELPPAADGRIHLRLFVDRSSLEVFANDGEAVITRRMYPNGQDIRVRLRNAGGALNIEEVRLWSLRSIWQGGGA